MSSHRDPLGGQAVLLVPLAYKPPTQADSAPSLPPWLEATMVEFIGSDFLFWSALHLARDQVVKVVLATPPERLVHASPKKRARDEAMLANILKVSQRADGLRSDSAVGKNLLPSRLKSIHMPTLVISARDDRYSTYASAQYTRLPQARREVHRVRRRRTHLGRARRRSSCSHRRVAVAVNTAMSKPMNAAR